MEPNTAERISLLRRLLESYQQLLTTMKETKKLDLFCKAIQEHEGWYPGSRSFRNQNPGNIRWIGQKTAIGKDPQNFAIFPDYFTGFEELKSLVRRAASGGSKIYRPDMTIYEFFAVYAPASDNNTPKQYAEVVAKKVGISPSMSLASLLV